MQEGQLAEEEGGICRLMGLDYGSRTVGVAVTDATGTLAVPVKTLHRPREGMLRKTLRELEALASQYGIGRIVLGLPLNMDGTEGERAEKTRAFAGLLSARLGLPVVFMDERLTTVEAQEILEENGIRGERQKELLDQVAAQVILESYMHFTEG